MHVACDNDAGAWTRRHHVNLLLTHHPTDWLRPQGLKTFHGEILTPGRFAAHLFGHMHRGRSEEIAIGGAQPRRSLQAPSLFGLDAWGEAHEDRSHGYLAGRISLEGPQATLRVWPRTGSRHAAGHIHIVQDAAAFMLEDDQACAPIQIPVNAEAMRPAKGRAEKIDAARSPFSGVTTAAQVVTKPSQAPNDAALLWRLVLGNDPIAGDRALRDLVSMGDKGQAELFAHAVRVPTLIQARRRLLKYVATRGDNILPEILRRLESEHYRDAHEIAFLLAAFSEAQNVTDPLYVLLKAAPRERKGDFFRAWGHSGGHPSVITRLVQESSWDWEKLRTDAFRGACVSVARQKSGALWTLAELVTRKYGEELPNDPEVTIGNGAVDEGELWLAYGTFAMWPRGAVADEISDLVYPRALASAELRAGILGSFGFSRITTPTIEWLKGESTAKVRSRLLGALDRAETEMGADAVSNSSTLAAKAKRRRRNAPGERPIDRRPLPCSSTSLIATMPPERQHFGLSPSSESDIRSWTRAWIQSSTTRDPLQRLPSPISETRHIWNGYAACSARRAIRTSGSSWQRRWQFWARHREASFTPSCSAYVTARAIRATLTCIIFIDSSKVPSSTVSKLRVTKLLTCWRPGKES